MGLLLSTSVTEEHLVVADHMGGQAGRPRRVPVGGDNSMEVEWK